MTTPSDYLDTLSERNTKDDPNNNNGSNSKPLSKSKMPHKFVVLSRINKVEKTQTESIRTEISNQVKALAPEYRPTDADVRFPSYDHPNFARAHLLRYSDCPLYTHAYSEHLFDKDGNPYTITKKAWWITPLNYRVTGARGLNGEGDLHYISFFDFMTFATYSEKSKEALKQAFYNAMLTEVRDKYGNTHGYSATVSQWIQTYCKDDNTKPSVVVVRISKFGDKMFANTIEKNRNHDTLKKFAAEFDQTPGYIIYKEMIRSQSRMPDIGLVLLTRSGEHIGGTGFGKNFRPDKLGRYVFLRQFGMPLNAACDDPFKLRLMLIGLTMMYVVNTNLAWEQFIANMARLCRELKIVPSLTRDEFTKLQALLGRLDLSLYFQLCEKFFQLKKIQFSDFSSSTKDGRLSVRSNYDSNFTVTCDANGYICVNSAMVGRLTLDDNNEIKWLSFQTTESPWKELLETMLGEYLIDFFDYPPTLVPISEFLYNRDDPVPYGFWAPYKVRPPLLDEPEIEDLPELVSSPESLIGESSPNLTFISQLICPESFTYITEEQVSAIANNTVKPAVSGKLKEKLRRLKKRKDGRKLAFKNTDSVPISEDKFEFTPYLSNSINSIFQGSIHSTIGDKANEALRTLDKRISKLVKMGEYNKVIVDESDGIIIPGLDRLPHVCRILNALYNSTYSSRGPDYSKSDEDSVKITFTNTPISAGLTNISYTQNHLNKIIGHGPVGKFMMLFSELNLQCIDEVVEPDDCITYVLRSKTSSVFDHDPSPVFFPAPSGSITFVIYDDIVTVQSDKRRIII